MKHENRLYEDRLYKEGYKLIGGVDEVGRGPLVGPVVASFVILPPNYYLNGLTDSKKLTKKKREYFYEIIKKDALCIKTVFIGNNIIDEINILEATKMAMKNAIIEASVRADYVLIDAVKLDIDIPYEAIVKGDQKSITISAASIIAKVERDRYMEDYALKYPEYGFETNAGYGTKKHLEALKKYGITKEHRRSFKPISDMIGEKYE